MTERLDPHLLDELQTLLEEDFAALLQTYLDHSAQLLAAAADGWGRGDLERVRSSAHSLKGSSSNVGAALLAALCAELEGHARDGRTDAIDDALERVRAELGKVRLAIEARHPEVIH